MLNEQYRFKRILFTTSTIPASDSDPVPAFVKDEAIWIKKLYPELEISVLAPHSAHSKTKKFSRQKYYDEYRFHYFWPYNLELLTGKGIQPALKKNKLLYFQLPGLFVAEFFATLYYIKKHRPDLIYAHWFTPQALTGALAAKITNTPIVFDTQASDAIVLKHVPFARKIIVGICHQALAYTVPSQQTLDKLLYFTDDTNREEVLSKVTMVPYGTSSVHVTDKSKIDVTKKYGLGNKKIIYFIGRLVDRKGVDLLIESFARLYKSDPNLRLVIVGDGQMRSNLEHLAQSLGVSEVILFTGFLTGTERYALLSISDVCVVPSINVGDQSEGLPVVFMEGVTFGKVVVVSDATGAHEIVKNKENAFVVKAGSIDNLTDGLGQALDVAKRKDPQFYQAVEQLAQRFQWPYIAKERYEALIGKNSNQR